MNINSIKLSFLTLGMLLINLVSFAQLSEEVEKLTPEFPGEVQIDFGFNLSNGRPAELDFNWFRSKSFAFYYIKPMEVSPNFSFRPGIGLSLEKLGQKHNRTIVNTVEFESTADGVQVPVQTLTYDTIQGNGIGEFKKSQIALNHVELPFELRYHVGGRNKNKIFIGVGASAALLFEAHTKVKYEKFGHMYKEKQKDDFNLSRFRYTAFGRIGIGSFGFFYKWHFTDVFSSGAPEGADKLGYSTVGISLSGF
ncbi:outer membrane beta-barrel protein [Reichenbachiella versicolor]|uniref:outer membrane beta-barrel protein n=1 Tax=Reichenbachiella versicolor TaxID=1821036 RepID=UPI000D6E123D|nr:outer membrane beta-barrel protein [Reichenbachiella versicolor]